jgi:single-stranded DNA-binding protein
MSNINNVTFSGNIGKDAEVHNEGTQKEFVTFSLAVGQGKDKPTMWYQVKCFRVVAAIAKDRARKGAQVVVVGKMEMNEKDGRQFYAIVADQVQFSGASQPGTSAPHSAPARQPASPPPASFESDNCPF